jgi:uncharacterized membrane protein YhdT
MDFLTFFPYLGIILIAVINAILVRYRDISIEDEDNPES